MHRAKLENMSLPDHLGKRHEMIVVLTEAQRDLIARCRNEGISKQQVVTDHIDLITENDLKTPEGYGEGNRKRVKMRLGEKVWEKVQKFRDSTGTTDKTGKKVNMATHAQVIEACANKALGV